MLQGDADDYVGGEQLRSLAAELQTAGAPLELRWLKGAGHLFDGPAFAPAVFRPRAQTLQTAQIVEGDPDMLRNSVTGEPFRWSDPQVGQGPTGRWRPFCARVLDLEGRVSTNGSRPWGSHRAANAALAP